MQELIRFHTHKFPPVSSHLFLCMNRLVGVSFDVSSCMCGDWSRAWPAVCAFLCNVYVCVSCGAVGAVCIRDGGPLSLSCHFFPFSFPFPPHPRFCLAFCGVFLHCWLLLLPVEKSLSTGTQEEVRVSPPLRLSAGWTHSFFTTQQQIPLTFGFQVCSRAGERKSAS